jgi:uncharacterized phage infection (PIP) family protein YhgE
MLTQGVLSNGRRRAPHRSLTIALALMIFAIATACGDANESATSTPSPTATSSPSPTATPSAIGAQWAESVCTAANDVRTSLDAIGSDLTIDVSADASALDQVKTKLRTQAAAARTSVTELRTAIETIPADAEGAAELKSSLGEARSDLEEKVQTVSEGVAETTAATNVRDFVPAAAQTVEAVREAKLSAEAFLTTAKQAASTAGGELKASFDSARSCVLPSESPS